MWLQDSRKLRKALRRYRDSRDLDAVLKEDWGEGTDLQLFFADVEARLHGEEIIRLRQKQAEYLALQNQINHTSSTMRSKRSVRMRCWPIAPILQRRLRRWLPFFDIRSPMCRSM